MPIEPKGVCSPVGHGVCQLYVGHQPLEYNPHVMSIETISSPCRYLEYTLLYRGMVFITPPDLTPGLWDFGPQTLTTEGRHI